ncbi:MAG: PbsX family transcriptional regulator, partial [Pseudomonas neustonica]
LASDNAVLALQPGRDSAPSLEQANIPLTQWHYLSEREIELSFAGEFDLRFSLRYAGSCELNVEQQRIKGVRRGALVEFAVNRHEVSNAILSCR